MAEYVRTAPALFGDNRHVASYNAIHAAAIHGPSARSDKHPVFRILAGGLSTSIDARCDGMARATSERHDAFAIALSEHPHSTGMQVDVPQSQTGEFCPTKTRSVQQLEDCEVPTSQSGAGIRQIHHLPGLFHIEHGRQPLFELRRLNEARRVGVDEAARGAVPKE